jgi:hypothetical protein
MIELDKALLSAQVKARKSTFKPSSGEIVDILHSKKLVPERVTWSIDVTSSKIRCEFRLSMPSNDLSRVYKTEFPLKPGWNEPMEQHMGILQTVYDFWLFDLVQVTTKKEYSLFRYWLDLFKTTLAYC